MSITPADETYSTQEDEQLVICEIEQILSDKKSTADNTDYKLYRMPTIQPTLLKTTLYLERRRRLYENDTHTTFTWSAVPTTNTQQGALCYVGQLRNVISIQIYSFTLFKLGQFFDPSAFYKDNIQILLSPLEAQSCINGKCRFHFAGKPYYDDSGPQPMFRLQFATGTYRNGAGDNKAVDYKYNRSSDLIGLYQFNEPITVIDDLSLTMFSDFSPLSLPSDTYTMEGLTLSGKDAMRMVLGEDPPLVPGGSVSTIFISGFTTTNPIHDAVFINTINRAEGWFGQLIGMFLMILEGFLDQPPIDFIELFAMASGEFVYDNVKVYINTFNFYIPIEFTHLA